MSKKLSLLMLLMALFAPWAANAQTREIITIGTGTGTNHYPLPGFYGWQYDVYLYTPSDASALNSDCTISSIAYNVSSNSTSTGSSMEIWVKDVDASYTLASTTTFSTYTSGATKVYNNSNFSSSTGWNTLSFSSPFSHTGGKTLLVAVRGVGCSTSGGCGRYCSYTSATNTWWYKHADGSDPGTSASGTVSSSRANIQLEINGGGGQGSDDDCDLSEDFDGVTGTTYSTAGSMPSGWYSYTTATGSSIVAPHVVSGSSYNYYHSGSQSLGMESGTNANNTAYAVMPAIASGKTYSSLSFYYRQENTSSGYGTLTVGYVMAQTSTGCSNFVSIQDITPSTTLHEETVDVNSVPANAYLAFRWIVTTGSYYACGIDDVCVTTVSSSSCPTPTSLAVVDNSITAQGATFTWNGSSDSYNVNVQQAGFIYDFESAEPWTITDFSPCSVYDGDQAAVYGMTDCDFENESGDDPVAMSCIAFQNGKTDYLYSHSGNAFGIMICPRASTGEAANDWFILPAITIGDNYVFSFWGREIKTDWGPETINVGIYNENNPGSFSSYLTNGQSISIDGLVWTQYNFDLSAYRNQTIRLAINYVSNDIFGFMLDDIYVGSSAWDYTYTGVTSPFVLNDPEQINPGVTYNVQVIGICGDEESNSSPIVSFTTLESCPKPTNFSYSNVTGHTATLSWDENGTATDWVLEYGTTSDFTGTTSVNVSNTASIQLTGLNGETTYYARVKTDCGNGDESNWATTSFTTTISCPAPTNLDVVEGSVTGHEATVTWTGSSESYNVYLGTEGAPTNILDVNFSSGIPNNWNNDATYPWTVTGGYIKSGNTAVASSSSSISVVATFPADGTIDFDAECMGEGSSSYYDHCDFYIDGTRMFYHGADLGSGWNHYTYDVTTGQHTFTWSYTKDSSVNPTGDYFAIDNVAMVSSSIIWGDPIHVENAQYTFSGLSPETNYFVKVQSDCGEEGLSAESEPVTFTTDVTCPAPTNLIVSEIDGHGATVSWDKIATQATGDITYNYTWVEHGGTPDWTLHGGMSAFDRWTNEAGPRAFAFGLDPETEYDFYVRRDCGEEGYSAEVMVSFTTTVTCPAPTDVTVSDITGHDATVTWTGFSENYVVELGNYDYTATPTTGSIQEEDFESGSMPTGWTHIGEGSVGVQTSYVHEGSYSLKFSGATADNVVVLPQFAATPNSLQISFWSKAEGSSSGNFDIGYVTDASDASSFVTIQSYSYSQHSNYEYVEDISMSTAPANARIAFRHRSGETYWYWFIDDITIKGPVYPIIWTEYTTDSPTYTFEGLTPETTYFVSVQGDCGDEGMSAMSDTISFTTDVTCPAPHDLTTSDVTSNSAVLHWTGDAESYNVSYYKAYFFESFEEDLSQWTIYKEGDEASMEWGIENPHDNTADLYAHGGDYAAVSYSDINVHADSWLVSPQIQFPNQTTLKFWIMRYTYDDTLDEYEVRLSTTGNAIEDFDVVLKEKTTANPAWTEVSIDLSAYDGQQGYIAIRHDYTGGFFIMVDDFGIYGWSEPIATTDNSLLIEDLLPETEYMWRVQADCGEEGESAWSNIGNFTTLTACPVPFDLNVSEITANGATIAWTGYNDSYNVWVGQLEMATINYDFEDNRISDDFINSTSYPWTVVQEGQGGGSCIKSGNSGVVSSTSAIEMTVDLVMDATLSFDFWSRGEGSNDSYDWDKSRFYIDGIRMFDYASHTSWESYSTTLTAGTHTLKWEYKKDGSTNPDGDCFYVDNITIESLAVSSEMNYTATESPLLLNDASYFLPETTYLVKIKGICDDEETEYSEAVTFTTLDENTKIFVIEGDWNEDGNWVPAGVPSIDENVILRAEATVFDVAEANTIAIDETGALIIEDGGQLKTNANVEATMKKFIIGYGTDYVETNNGYYLMTLPTAAPVAAADAGLITEESDFDLYSWDRTATDEEWQNNHDGIDLQNGVGFLYANRDDMEMSFTATLRNSGEPVVVTPAFDDVEHGGWNLCANPFPCEAYITTDAEGMTFYRLVDNELVPIEGAIAPLEAFFVKATAAGQTFTISREAPAK